MVIDVQNDVVGQAYRRDEVVGNIGRLVDAARVGGVPVVWVQHQDDFLAPGTAEWEIVEELVPAPGEARIDKRYRSSFEATDLETVLGGLGVDTVVLCGAESNNCVRHTLHAALERGYDVTLVGDAHTTWHGTWDGVAVDGKAIIDEQNRNADGYRLPGRECSVRSTADITAQYTG